jgi:hypothetical protein
MFAFHAVTKAEPDYVGFIDYLSGTKRRLELSFERGNFGRPKIV